MLVGYTQGAFDMFHIGHLNLLERARSQCDHLIVGVNSDELVQNYKQKTPIIPQEERLAIVRALRCVDEALQTETLDKVYLHEQLHFDKLFIGDDWRGNERWAQTERDMERIGVEFVWLTYTKGISSTLLRSKIESEV